MLKNSVWLRVFAAEAAVLWCLLFMQSRTTEQSMVRAVLLQRGEYGWEAGLLYQAPEAAADASDANAEVSFCAAKGESLAGAFEAAERLLPQEANYRLCDHALICSGGAVETASDYEQLILQRLCGRLSAKVFACGFTCEELTEQSEEVSSLPQKLLQSAKQAAGKAPRLYEVKESETALLPVLVLTGDGAACASGGLLCADGKELELTPEQTQAALLLSGKGGNYSFEVDGEPLELAYALCSLTAEQNGFVLRVDCVKAPAAPPVSRAAAESLAKELDGVIRLFWANSCDILRLSEARSLRYGENTAIDIKQAQCPQIELDVSVY